MSGGSGDGGGELGGGGGDGSVPIARHGMGGGGAGGASLANASAEPKRWYSSAARLLSRVAASAALTTRCGTQSDPSRDSRCTSPAHGRSTADVELACRRAACTVAQLLPTARIPAGEMLRAVPKAGSSELYAPRCSWRNEWWEVRERVLAMPQEEGKGGGLDGMGVGAFGFRVGGATHKD